MSEASWRSALQDALAARPDVSLDRTGFTSHAEECRSAGGAAPEHLADLFLAWAAGRGDPAALRAFDTQVLDRIDPAVRRVDPSASFADEVRQELRVRLLLPAGDGPPRIAEYQARGALLAWVRVAAMRAALNLKRGQRPTVPADDVFEQLVGRDPDPETRHLKTLYRAEFADALRASLAALPDRSRAILRLHFADGMQLARIAALYGVHESTASRWVKAAVEAASTDTRRRLLQRLRLSPASLDSVTRMIQSNLDMSIRAMLVDGAPSESDG